ncbi:fimbrial biogenesis chaperone [Proteus appendicitidis]|uniref:Molecular chaperone n=1 Tax=Proteus appendicitidis TaxID=3034648 RepID=A0ABY8Y3C8_9GAMM|nr:molecular chaperone [Proteus sp. HZ0627]WIV86899.1 molecular chaperone [Proteus sp. HZ0627]
MKKLIVFLMALILPTSVFANIIINGTRVIYYEGTDSVNLQLTNNGDLASLVQSWIDDGDINSTPEDANSPFYLYPPIVKIAGRQGQTLRIKNSNEKSSGNVEQVYYLNILDIPENAEALKGKSYLQLAMKTRIKVFYRPKDLTDKPELVNEKITYQLNGDKVLVKNNSQYHFTIASISTQETPRITLVDSEMIPPLSSRELPLINKLKSNSAVVIYVDDFGVYKSQNIKL